MPSKDDIIAKEQTLKGILSEHYTLDYYQREYSWGKEHVERLIEDLLTAFGENYDREHKSQDVREYGTYYMGPVVFSKNEKNEKAIVDGQQRLTSLTLLLLCLEHLQNRDLNEGEQVEIGKLIYADDFGTPKFKIRDKSRDKCMSAILNEGTYSPRPEDTATVQNISKRYEDLAEAVDNSDLSEPKTLRAFLYWLRDKVILVSITAGTADKAYLVFETMNDRGLRLESVEMLKAYLISRVSKDKRQEINDKWRRLVQQLNEEIKKDGDSEFFHAWLRAHYADTIRGSNDKQAKDFEKIGTRFHIWVRENEKKILSKDKGEHDFIDKKMEFYVKQFLDYHHAMETPTQGLEHLYRVKFLKFAESLLHPLLLAPIKESDDEETIKRKLNLVARYVETFCVRKAVNFHQYAQRAIKFPMYGLVKKIRFKDVSELSEILKKELEYMPETLDGILKSDYGTLRKTAMNGKFIKFLLASITAHIEQKSGMGYSLQKYMEPDEGKPFEIEHILANKFQRYKDEYEDETEFQNIRNMVGGLILLPEGTNQAFSDAPFDKKGKHYLKENLLAQSLCKECYERNPNFVNHTKELSFKSYNDFGKDAIIERQELYRQIAGQVWDIAFFDKSE